MTSSVRELLALNHAVIDVAKELKVSRGAVYQSLDGNGSRNIRVHIAVKLGKKPSELWKNNNADSLATDNAMYFMQVGYYE